MAPILPQDILFLICEALLDQREFHTLFCCSLTSKSLLVPAISNLYRYVPAFRESEPAYTQLYGYPCQPIADPDISMQDVAPVTAGGGEDAPTKSGPDSIAGWARLWGTLIRSSLGKTKYPYCRYIRVLNLHDIQSLLEDQTFRNVHSKSFFAGDMAFLRIEREAPAVGPKKKGRPAKPLDVPAIIRRVADLITDTAPMIQELAGSLDTESLTEWIPRIQRLQNLRLWDGMSVQGLGPLIREHCPHFANVSFFNTRAEASDVTVAEFLSELRPDSLQTYEVFGADATETEIFTAFNQHAKSLTSLKLQSLPGEGLANMASMSECTALRTLHVQIKNAPTLDGQSSSSSSSPPLPGVVSWLRSCKQLSDLSFDSSYESEELFLQMLTPVLLDADVRLTQLSVTNYAAPAPSSPHAMSFYNALTNQAPSLHSLTLRSDGDNVDNDALVAALAYLKNLTYLRLHTISDMFQDRHIIAAVASLPALEELWISGWAITDAVWDAMAGLRSLRRLEMTAFSAFTFEGILGFIAQLDPTRQRGFVLSIMMADPAGELAQNEDAQNLLRREIAARVDGRFDYTPARDPNAEEYSSSDSD